MNLFNEQPTQGNFLDEPYFSRIPHLLEWRTLSHVMDLYRLQHLLSSNSWQLTLIEHSQTNTRTSIRSFEKRPTEEEIFQAFLDHLGELKQQACLQYGPQAACYYP